MVPTVGQGTGPIGDQTTNWLFPVGLITLSDWAAAVESVLHLGLPWRMLRPQLVNSSTDNMLEYKPWLEDLAKEQLSHEVMMRKWWMGAYCGPWSSWWRTWNKINQKGRWKGNNYLLSFHVSDFMVRDLHMLLQHILKITTTERYYQPQCTHEDTDHRGWATNFRS